MKQLSGLDDGLALPEALQDDAVNRGDDSIVPPPEVDGWSRARATCRLVFRAADAETGRPQRFPLRRSQRGLRRFELVARDGARRGQLLPAPEGLHPRQGRQCPVAFGSSRADRGLGALHSRGQLRLGPCVQQRRLRRREAGEAPSCPAQPDRRARNLIRRSRPATGAETTKRLCTRVSPSSLMVT